MVTKTMYWVQKTGIRIKGFTLKIEECEIGKFVYLLENTLRELEKPFMIGSVDVENNRGMTVTCATLTTRNLDVFYSNGEFNKYTEEEYKKLYPENN